MMATPRLPLSPRPLYGQIRGFGAYGGQPPYVLSSVFSGYGQPPVNARNSGVFDTPNCGPPRGVPYAPSPYNDPRIMPAPCPPPRGCQPVCPPGFPPPFVPPPRGCPPPQARRACPPGPPPPFVPPPQACDGYGYYGGFGSADGLYGYR
jgi:hypothetical protein